MAYREFGSEICLTDQAQGNRSGSQCAGMHNIVTLGDTIFVVWRQGGDGNGGIYLRRSIDGGETFGVVTQVCDSLVHWAYWPTITSDRLGNIYVAWSDDRDGDGPSMNVYFAKSTDGGLSFGPDVRVDDAGMDPSRQNYPAIAVDDSLRVYVVWMDERGWGDSGVYTARSLDGGATFGPSTPLLNSNPWPPYEGWPQYGADIAAEGDGRVYVSYIDYWHLDNGPPPYMVFVRRSNDAGATFSDPVLVEDYTTMPQHTSITIAGPGEVYVAWAKTEDYPVVSKSTNGAETFCTGVQLTYRQACCGLDGMDVSLFANSSGWVALAWKDSIGVIGYSECRNGDMLFLPPVLIRGPERNYAGVAMTEDHTCYMAWTDYRRTQQDIYFLRGIPDPPAGIRDDDITLISTATSPVARPNPFTSTVLVSGDPRLSSDPWGVYDVSGRLVRYLTPGDGRAEWDGFDREGGRVAPGIYIIRPTSCGGARGVKVVLNR
jgi:hypothetical protein